MAKQIQFELWQECNSQCKFCYLGKDNRHTPNELKLMAMQKAFDKISDLSIYDEFDTIAFLGGEFFQGQMSDPLVKEKFMELMEKSAWLLNNEYITHFWIYATLTIGDQEDLYETLKLFENHKGEVWVLTSYDTMGRFHTQKMEDNWKFHMKKIHELYPDIKFNTTTILTEDCIDKYLSGELSFKHMMEEYHTEFFFKQCGALNESKAKTNERIPHFFPPRHKFLQFLAKFRQEESDLMWTKLFNIYYRADNLYRNFNDKNRQMTLSVRHKDSVNEVSTNCEFEMRTAPCGHLLSYSAYSDCDGCCICDKQMIEDLYK